MKIGVQKAQESISNKQERTRNEVKHRPIMEICTKTKTDLSNEVNPDSSKVSDPPSTQIRASRTLRMKEEEYYLVTNTSS